MDFTAPFRSLLPVSGWVAKVYLTMTVVLQVDLAWCLIVEWPQFTQRLLTLKEINFSVFGLVGCLAVEEAHRLLDYAEAHAQRCRGMNATREEIAVLAERDSVVKSLGRTVEILFTSFQVFFGFTPLAAMLLRILLNPRTPSRLPSVLHIYYPQIYPLNTLTARIVINTLSFFWYYKLVNFWKLNAKSLFVTFQCLVTDIQLLCCAFEIMSARKSGISDKELRKFLNSAAIDHQRICE
ncbi:hypothetical protein LSTR_LSTR006269 [Laodelphax striatellus]|uniref:Odorant receptor n=1 Tax=Laodelphax striatellus TaxID=195883 RepID=A0A482WRK5_LAOST|nr:hypothetical protein LSTR_LSTR006269 [Laodelphax striatellus]